MVGNQAWDFYANRELGKQAIAKFHEELHFAEFRNVIIFSGFSPQENGTRNSLQEL